MVRCGFRSSSWTTLPGSSGHALLTMVSKPEMNAPLKAVKSVI